MPIYAYRCSACGFEKDALQKLSDAPLTQCPECGKETFSKQVTAAGFQLKGSGWYVTDFRGGNAGATATKPAADGAAPAASASGGDGVASTGASAAPAAGGTTGAASASSTSSTSAGSTASGSTGSSAGGASSAAGGDKKA